MQIQPRLKSDIILWGVFLTIGSVIMAITITASAHEQQDIAVRQSTAADLVSEAPLALPWTDKFSVAAWNSAAHRSIAISREIDRFPAHDWAGTYGRADGPGVRETLTLAPMSGFVLRWHGVAEAYDQNFGSVGMLPSKVILNGVFPPDSGGLRATPKSLIPIHWGGRHYLVAPDDLKSFRDWARVNQAPTKELHGVFFLREGDGRKAVTGLPSLPREYRSYISRLH